MEEKENFQHGIVKIYSEMDISIPPEIQTTNDKSMPAKLKKNWLDLKAAKFKFENVGIYYPIRSTNPKKS